MKRVIAIIITTFMMAGIVAAEEGAEVLIDFDQLSADFTISDPNIGDHQENQRTIVDFSREAGSTFSEQDRAMMKTSLAIKNWEVRLSSSSRTVVNQEYSLAKQATVRDEEDVPEAHFRGKNVLGVRIHFPTEMHNAWAVIKPPFEIPAYQDKTTMGNDGQMTVTDEDRGKGDMFTNIGIVKNVGVLKTVDLNVHGLNFPHKISIIVKNSNNEEQEILMGHLQFDGWRKLHWDNPNYIFDVRNRNLIPYPLYPKTAPMIKLTGIRIYRDGMHEGDDFIGYIKDISITFDRAVKTGLRDIDDEAVWGILQKREESRRNAELRRLGNIQVLRYLEVQKMYHEDQQPPQGGQQQQPQ
ncbi:MAG: flagellar filament outer layer protein FlaA [Spirochaetales bacterium]|nr:flagellar filament outer layer protein FlaA [Spirochaetales bacterium]